MSLEVSSESLKSCWFGLEASAFAKWTVATSNCSSENPCYLGSDNICITFRKSTWVDGFQGWKIRNVHFFHLLIKIACKNSYLFHLIEQGNL